MTQATGIDLGKAFAEHYRRLHKIITQQFQQDLSEQDIDDVLQNVFLAAVNHADRLDTSEAALKQWLYITSIRYAIMRQRHINTLTYGIPVGLNVYAIAPHLEEADEDTVESAILGECRDRAARIFEAYESLYGRHSSLIEGMSYFLKATLANMSYEELAEEYGVPIGTIKSRMNRAVTHIRKLAQVGCYHQGPELL